ncbi:hypothetical protein ES703_114209 [subsurface metagenome]
MSTSIKQAITEFLLSCKIEGKSNQILNLSVVTTVITVKSDNKINHEGQTMVGGKRLVKIIGYKSGQNSQVGLRLGEARDQ